MTNIIICEWSNYIHKKTPNAQRYVPGVLNTQNNSFFFFLHFSGKMNGVLSIFFDKQVDNIL